MVQASKDMVIYCKRHIHFVDNDVVFSDTADPVHSNNESSANS